jgi:hypothetical protein
MARIRFFLRAGRLERLLGIFLGTSVIVGILFGLCSVSEAQSGRRVPKRSEPASTRPSPATTEPERPAEDQPPEPARAEPVKPQYSLVVVADTSNVSSNRNISSYILGNCVRRLQETPLLAVTVDKAVNRKKASDMAKLEKERYVVWVEFEGDNFGGNTRISDYYVTYIIYTPVTGKQKDQGRVYLRQYQNVPTVGVGGIGVPIPVPLPPGTTLPGQSPGGVRTPIEQSLEQAGIETADRIMNNFNIAAAPARRYPLLESGN